MRNKRREWRKRRKRQDRYRVIALVCLIAAALMTAAGGLWLAVDEKSTGAVAAAWAEVSGGRGPGGAGETSGSAADGPGENEGTSGGSAADGSGENGRTSDGGAVGDPGENEGTLGGGRAGDQGTDGGISGGAGADSGETGGTGSSAGAEAGGKTAFGETASVGGQYAAGMKGAAQGGTGAGNAAGLFGGGEAAELPGGAPGTAQAAGSLQAQGQAFRAGRPKVKGIYVTGAMAGTANMDQLIDLVDRTELNALVIDVKNDEGYVVCDMDAPLVSEVGSVRRYVKDMPELIRKCKEKGIYLIARIVAFKDPVLAEAKPEWSLHNADGTIFRDKSGLAWVNPYEEQVWEYLLQVAQGAAALGFDEIQFDYVRFSTDSGMKQVDFGPKAGQQSREEAIETFVAYVTGPLHQMSAAVSADVYGVVIDSQTDQQIVGQNYVNLAAHLDYLSPMVYPSHYGPYNYNIPIPDAQPYDTVLAAMQASRLVMAGIDPKQKTAAGAGSAGGAVPGTGAGAAGGTISETGVGSPGGAAAETGVGSPGGAAAETAAGSAGGTVPAAGTVSGNEASAAPVVRSAAQIAALPPMDTVRASVRPWLQDFTATWVKGHIKYGPEQIRAQIQAVYDAGYEEWILWNASNRYTEGGLLPETQE